MILEHLDIKRIPPFEKWKKDKILVMHMEAPHLDVEDCLRTSEIPFTEIAYDTPNLDEKLNHLMNECFGVIITGSLKSGQVYPDVPKIVIESNFPKLGLCYGCEVLGMSLGSDLEKCNEIGEFGEVECTLRPSELFRGIDVDQKVPVYMAHHLMLDSIPKGSKIIASTEETPIAGFENLERKMFGLQFHPEKDWMGEIVFKNFYEICKEF